MFDFTIGFCATFHREGQIPRSRLLHAGQHVRSICVLHLSLFLIPLIVLRYIAETVQVFQQEKIGFCKQIQVWSDCVLFLVQRPRFECWATNHDIPSYSNHFEGLNTGEDIDVAVMYTHIEIVVAFLSFTFPVRWSSLGTMKELRGAIRTEFFL